MRLVGRMILVRMSESFFGREDSALTDRLLAELPGILLWSIEGWRRLRERGRFVQPDSATELLSDMADLASPIRASSATIASSPPASVPPWPICSPLGADGANLHGRKEAGTEQWLRAGFTGRGSRFEEMPPRGRRKTLSGVRRHWPAMRFRPHMSADV